MNIKMKISMAKLFAFTTIVLMGFLVSLSRPCAQVPLFLFNNVAKAKESAPLIDITPALTGEDTHLFQNSFNPSNKVLFIFIRSD
jgi:hypothetical protein